MYDIVLKQAEYAKVLAALTPDAWIVACLCAGWCNACRGYKPEFMAMAERYPEVRFLWIDIEDHADLMDDDLDVDNFPFLLMQYGDTVNFFSSVHPDIRQAERLLKNQVEQGLGELKRLAQSNQERRYWQEKCNLRKMLAAALHQDD